MSKKKFLVTVLTIGTMLAFGVVTLAVPAWNNAPAAEVGADGRVLVMDFRLDAPNDLLLTGPAPAVGSILVPFNADEFFVDQLTLDTVYENGEDIIRGTENEAAIFDSDVLYAFGADFKHDGTQPFTGGPALVGEDTVVEDLDGDNVYTKVADITIDTDGTATNAVGAATAVAVKTALIDFVAGDFVYYMDDGLPAGISANDSFFLDLNFDGNYDLAECIVLGAGAVLPAADTVYSGLVSGNLALVHEDPGASGTYNDGEDIFWEETVGSKTYSAAADNWFINAEPAAGTPLVAFQANEFWVDTQGTPAAKDDDGIFDNNAAMVIQIHNGATAAIAAGQPVYAFGATDLFSDTDGDTFYDDGEAIVRDGAVVDNTYLDQLAAITFKGTFVSTDRLDVAALNLYKESGATGGFQMAEDAVPAQLVGTPTWDGVDGWELDLSAGPMNIPTALAGGQRLYLVATAETLLVDESTMLFDVPVGVDGVVLGTFATGEEGIFYTTDDNNNVNVTGRAGHANTNAQTFDLKVVVLNALGVAVAGSPFDTIALALAAGGVNFTALVPDGEFQENGLVIGFQGMTLQSSGSMVNTIINGQAGGGILLQVTASGVTIGGSGLTFMGTNPGAAGLIALTGAADNVTIQDCYLLFGDGSAGDFGILTQAGVDNLTVTDTTFRAYAGAADTTGVYTNPHLTNSLFHGTITNGDVAGTKAVDSCFAIHGGDTITIEDSILEDGQWLAITLYNTASNVTIQNNEISGWYDGDAIKVDDGDGGPLGGPVTIQGNEIFGNDWAIEVENGMLDGGHAFDVHYNQIYNNPTWGIENLDVNDDIDARFNWWGAANGPAAPGVDPVTGRQAIGDGDKVSLHVRFDTWWMSYAGGATTATYTYDDGAGWYGMSVPLDPADPTPSVVYDEMGAGVAIYGAWPYSSYQTNPDVDPNRGTWLYLSGNTTITVEGTELTADQTLNFATAGWYLISVPYTADWGTAVFSDASDFYNNGATPAGVALWACAQPSGGYPVVYSTATPTFVLNPWVSYWVKALTAGASITFTKSPFPATPITSMALAPMGLHGTPTVSPPPPPALQSGGISVALSENADGIHFVAAGPALSLRAKILSVDGALIAETTAAGNELVWAMKTSAGELVANGVYLIQISAETYTGWVDLGLFRVLVLR